MGKILLLLLVGLAAYLILRSYRRSLDAPPRSDSQAVEDMVKCAHCGVNLPRSESIYSGGHFYCTAEHRELGPS